MMEKKNLLMWLAGLVLLSLLVACAGLDSGTVRLTSHPQELGQGKPTCTQCHRAREGTMNFQRFNHNGSFIQTHRMEAYQNEQLCAMCHQTSFCNDCHATRVELKPSIKNQTETYRSMPHRGDYLSRHRIDGRLDPTSCFRCHGSPKSATTCIQCHG
ncbi:cytochrome C [Desulfuromonas sp. KJ2020]|uniref:cytochrome C n=1 Tax=Desulfuromonas sp. KJ2020 TaxID=2919173 RepID=UPI0020A75423|nr:cytochrome C [Desulfuromonas sp. KJ2020]MCP3175493.1 cytochrome C [Desulfuromonas sp. KJ2020]